MGSQNGEETSGTQAPCCCGGSTADGAASGSPGASCCGGDVSAKGAAEGGSGASCGCGTTTAARCPAGTVLTVLLILAALGVGIYALVSGQ